jgi:hypothetical protein
MLMPSNFEEYTTNKQRMLDIINEKKELFIVTLKGGIPEVQWNEINNYTLIIRNIEIENSKCYILKFCKNENDESVKKMKGVFFRLNDNIKLENYKSCLL